MSYQPSYQPRWTGQLVEVQYKAFMDGPTEQYKALPDGRLIAKIHYEAFTEADR
jgi:hypothetical protein